MYFMVHCNEDGTSIRQYDTKTDLLEEVKELTSEDLRPDSRATFGGPGDPMPDYYSPENYHVIIEGRIVQPTPVKTVTEWDLDS